jgi:hypothetical protein
VWISPRLFVCHVHRFGGSMYFCFGCLRAWLQKASKCERMVIVCTGLQVKDSCLSLFKSYRGSEVVSTRPILSERPKHGDVHWATVQAVHRPRLPTQYVPEPETFTLCSRQGQAGQ